MTAYTATVTSPLRHALKIDNVTGVGLYYGTCAVSNYNQTLAEITSITGKFKTAPHVVTEGVSSNGYLVRWDTTGKSFKAYYPDAVHTHTLYVATGATDSSGARVNAATNSLAMNNAAASIAGIAAASGSAGGIVQSTAVAGSQVASDVDVGSVKFVAYGIL